MVSSGSKASGSRRHLSGCGTEGSLLAGEVIVTQDTVGRIGKKGRKRKKRNVGSHGDSAKNKPGGLHSATFKAKKIAEDKTANTPQASFIRSGSHVAETALKFLAMHLQNDDTYSLVGETLTAFCQEIVVNGGDIMCNSYGSHVLRRLLCFCKGVSVDSLEFHGTKPSVVLAERLNLRSSKLEGNDLQQHR